MKVYIANFGRANYLWPECQRRDAVVVFEDQDLGPFWLAQDREGYIQHCIRKKRTAAGIVPPPQVASRWFNIGSIVSSTSDDLWIHREKSELWWTISRPQQPETVLGPGHEPGAPEVYVTYKPAQPSSNKSKSGARLAWDALHPKARDFLFTEGTLQKLDDDNAAYAQALVNGDDLSKWHTRAAWQKRAAAVGKGAGSVYDAVHRAVVRMVMTAVGTVGSSNGQQVLRTVKNKELRFSAQLDLERYVAALLVAQDHCCAITGLGLQFDGEHDDVEMLASLDRIDSDGHYEAGNLQVVCRFVNRWKNNSKDSDFRRLIELVQKSD